MSAADRTPAWRHTVALVAILIVSGCATTPFDPADCPPGTQKLADCPPANAVQDPVIARQYDRRSQDFASRAGFDPVAYSRTVDIPVLHASAKFIGSTNEGGLESIAAKIWMVENAEHTIDVMYYILREDLVGFALLGAVCDAVQRGVDARVMIDSIGSSDFSRKYLRAVESCALDGGFIRNGDGEVTVHKARAQALIFNAATTSFANPNRRSHDKLIIKDGAFVEKAYAVTGGRNMSLDYYGFNEDGSFNTHTYRDADIIVRGVPISAEGEIGIGEVTGSYYTLLFTFEKNKQMTMSSMGDPYAKYRDERELFRESLAKLKALPQVAEYLDAMDEYMTTGFSAAPIRLAHNLGNITNKNVVKKAVENLAGSPNSVIGILNRLRDLDNEHIRIVSPYLFAAYYKDKDGNVSVDEAQRMLDWLDENPDSKLTIVTNSVITGDNIFTQSVIDVNLVPRLLLTEDQREQWSKGLSKGEENPELVTSDAWIRAMNHPRLFVYETGRVDDVRFGGDQHYSKLHAKYIVGDTVGFVGTTNFDYRSRLYNSEMGYFFDSEELVQEIIENTDYLISTSYRWGSPEWLEMRRQFRETKGTKAYAARHQRGIYKTINTTGLMWWF
jgi:phosphatidylserine/phosphatidylglycerophosphate/cardiolipin synthase-like enzyme